VRIAVGDEQAHLVLVKAQCEHQQRGREGARDI
jgi:hypothetical protein